MAKDKAVWGIDIGQKALKALKLEIAGGELQATAFDIVEHPQILSDPEANQKELIRGALEQFLSRNSVAGSAVCVSVPGQSSFTRFVKLPPVETKKIPDIVRFEAEQQIPFSIEDVIWRWQTFQEPDSPDVEVGIFAMKRDDVAAVLSHFAAVEMDVDVVQMAPLALYNFLAYDGQAAPDGATVLADVGAEKTDLVVSEGARIWTRTIQIGGNNFTEALVKSFKLSFAKAEKLKRTAASSKYARQIFQAMRPVFSDLVQEIQRSVGYYTSLHREARFTRLVGIGNGFRLPGLQKFLEQNLNIPVVRIDSYNKLSPAGGVNTPVFTENVLSFAVSYGLALQGLEQGTVATNLLPAQIARARQWQRKRPWFAATAAAALLIFAIMLYRAYDDKAALAVEPGGDLAQAQRLSDDQGRLQKQYSALQGKDQKVEQAVRLLDQYEYRDYWPSLMDLVSRGIASQARDQRLIDEYAAAEDKEQIDQVLAKIKAIRRDGRRMFFLESMESSYRENVYEDSEDKAAGRGGGSQQAEARGFELTINGRTPLAEREANRFLAAILRSWNQQAQRFPMISVVDSSQQLVKGSEGRAGKRAPIMMKGEFPGMKGLGAGEPGRDSEGEIPQAEQPDPMFPDDPSEDMAKDTRFEMKLVVTVEQVQEAGSTGGR